MTKPTTTTVWLDYAANAVDQPVLYISGPMRGIPDDNFPTFNEVAAALRSIDFTVNNPAENFNGDRGRDWAEYMHADLIMLLESDGIVLLPGWENSEGAKLEYSVAKAIGLEFYEAQKLNDEWVIVSLWDEPEGGHTIPPEMPEMRDAETIDQEARRLVYGERAKVYGHPRGDFDKIAGIWAAILGTPVTAEQVAVCMAGLKLARLASSPNFRDSQVDVIGYILCLARLQEDVTAWNEQMST